MSAQSRERRARMARERQARMAAELPAPRPLRSARMEARISNRPLAIWHPLPVSEVCMLVGLVAIVFGLLAGRGGGQAPDLAAGIGAMAIGVIEFCLREHLTGYRKHRALLAVLATILFHFAVIAFVPFRVIGIPALSMDIIVFISCFYIADRVWRRASGQREAKLSLASSAGGEVASGMGA